MVIIIIVLPIVEIEANNITLEQSYPWHLDDRIPFGIPDLFL